MKKSFISLGEASLAIDGLEVMDDELILVHGGFAGARGGSGCDNGYGCGCSGGKGCGCNGGGGCGCGCSVGNGCGCDCSTPTVAP